MKTSRAPAAGQSREIQGFTAAAESALSCDPAGEFFSKFGASPAQRKSYKPLFLALASSASGELAQSFGLFEKSGSLFEVSGTECSMRGFDGQFSPEPTSIAELRHRAALGNLGRSDLDQGDLYAFALLAALDRLEPRFGAEPGQPEIAQELLCAQPFFELWQLSEFGPYAMFDHPLLHSDKRLRERFCETFAARAIPESSIAERRGGEQAWPFGSALYRIQGRGIAAYVPVTSQAIAMPLVYCPDNRLLRPGLFPELRSRLEALLDDAASCIELGADLTGDGEKPCRPKSPAR